MVIACLDVWNIHTKLIVPPSMKQFNELTGNNLKHGSYGRILDKYCKIHQIDRRAMKREVRNNSQLILPFTGVEMVITQAAQPAASRSQGSRKRRAQNSAGELDGAGVAFLHGPAKAFMNRHGLEFVTCLRSGNGTYIIRWGKKKIATGLTHRRRRPNNPA